MHAIALVDYDNVRDRDPNRPERRLSTSADHEFRATDLVAKVTRAFQGALPDLDELDLLLYGGWTAENGLLSPTAQLLLPIVASLRGRNYGTIVRPVLSDTMAQFPLVSLRGTIRLESRRRRQKMVDGILGFDALHFAKNDSIWLGIVSDDDDMIPALLTAHDANRSRTIWFRKRAVGSGLNDAELERHGVLIHSLDEDAST